MNPKLTAFILAIAAAMCMHSAVQCKPQAPSDPAVSYDELGFKLEIPEPFEKHSQNIAGVKVADVYIHNGLAYIVMVTPTPSNTLASTAIEKSIQTMYKLGPARSANKRWETTTKQDKLFKGISRSAALGDDASTSLPSLKDVLKGKPGYLCLSLAPVKDESSPILAVGVIGTMDRQSEIETQAKFAAFTVAEMKSSPTPPAPRPSKQPVQAPVRTPVQAPSQVAKKPVTPAPPKPKARPQLRKGEIQLLGSVESVDKEARAIHMVVDQVTLPSQSPVQFDTPRLKVVLFKDLPNGVNKGGRLVVIGRNTGIGKPMTANFLEAIPQGR